MSIYDVMYLILRGEIVVLIGVKEGFGRQGKMGGFGLSNLRNRKYHFFVLVQGDINEDYPVCLL